MQALNPNHLTPENLARMAAEFQGAKPYNHIVIDNFLQQDVAESLYGNFPKMTELRKHYNGLNENKSEGSSFDTYHPNFAKVIADITSPEFIKMLEQITGIDNLSIPPDHRGAGVHLGKAGSYLDVHVDFSVHPTLNMHRQLNLLIYMNKDWQEEWGGHIELWNHDVTKLDKKVLPILNRCVIFQCSEISYHGYDKISPPETESRKSIYAYYYTPVGPGVRYHDTIFKARPSEGTIKKIKTDVKETLKNAAKRMLLTLGLSKVFDKLE